MVDYQDMKIKLQKNKHIGKVLFIVEGTKTEPYILKKIFTKIFDYQLDTKLRGKSYMQYNSKTDPYSRVFVINAQESNIKYIKKDDKYLDNLFLELIENYGFDIDNAAIFYIYDRDDRSNTNSVFLKNMMTKLANSRDNYGNDRQGLLLLSYPSIESFTLSCFMDNTFSIEIETGKKLKTYLGSQSINHQKIDELALLHATTEMLTALGYINKCKYDLDNFSKCNLDVFTYEENVKSVRGLYKCMSLFIICLIDLGLIELEFLIDK